MRRYEIWFMVVLAAGIVVCGVKFDEMYLNSSLARISLPVAHLHICRHLPDRYRKLPGKVDETKQEGWIYMLQQWQDREIQVVNYYTISCGSCQL